MTLALFNHLWQSTLFALAACGLILLFRRGSSWSRHFIAWAAIAQFVIPFSFLASLIPTAPEEDIVRELSFLSHVPGTLEATANIGGFQSRSIAPDVTRITIPWLTILGIAWFCGFALLLTRRWIQYARCRNIIARKSRSPGSEWNDLARMILGERSHKLPRLVITDDDCLHGGVFGFFRTTIVIPEEMDRSFESNDREAFLRHELQHVLKHDNFFLHLQKFIRDLLWFHPLAYWLDRQISIEREIMRDEEVLGRTNNKESYISCLMKASNLNLSENNAAGVGIYGSSLKRRLEAIASYQSNAVARMLSACASVITVSALAAVFFISANTIQAGTEDRPVKDQPVVRDVPLQELLRRQLLLEERLRTEERSIEKTAVEHIEVVERLKYMLYRDNLDRWNLSKEDRELAQHFVDRWMTEQSRWDTEDNREEYIERRVNRLKEIRYEIRYIKNNVEGDDISEEKRMLLKELKAKAVGIELELKRIDRAMDRVSKDKSDG